MNSKKAIRIYNLSVLCFMIWLMVAYPVAAASVWTTDSSGTNKTDFAPGDTVYISGEGFSAANESTPVQINVTRPPNSEGIITTHTCPDPKLYWCPNSLPTTPEFSLYPYKLDGIEGTYTILASDGTNPAQATFTDVDIKLDYPSGGETLSGTVAITWHYKNYDLGPFDYEVYYKYASSCGSGFISTPNWIKIGTQTCGKSSSSCSYSWDTTSVSDGTHYCIGVIKVTGYFGQDRTGSNVIINNAPSCTDNDNDGYGSPASSSCTHPELDCDDADNTIHPGATEVCNDGIDNNCNTFADCADTSCQPCITIVADKVICDAESKLPNWGGGASDITSTTASSYVSANSGCALASGWNFQYSFGNQANPGDNVTSASTPWVTFGPTDGSGRTSVVISKADTGLWFREELKAGYLGFSGAGNSNTVTAEFYCDGDVLNYDNYDNIHGTPSDGAIYYCVGFNALAQVCGNGVVEGTEECDLGAQNGQSTSCCDATCHFVAAQTVCRAAAGVCDVAESCTGSSATCPANAKKPNTFVCRQGNLPCDPEEKCDGSSVNCPADLFAHQGTSCGTCAECNGAGSCSQMPADDTNCGTIDCDGLDTICRNYDDITMSRCKSLGVCKSAPADCNSFLNAPLSTPCEADQLFCTVDHCDGNGACAFLNNKDCSANNLPEIATCDNNPDNSPKTWDYAAAVPGVCNDVDDKCEYGTQTPTHTCADADNTDGVVLYNQVTQTCSAECDGAGTECLPYIALDDYYCYYNGQCNTNPAACACNYANNEYCPESGTVDTQNNCYWGTEGCNVDGCTLNVTSMGCKDTCDGTLGPIDTIGPVTSAFNAVPVPPMYNVPNTWKTEISSVETENCTTIKAAEYFVSKNVCWYPDNATRGTSLDATDEAFDEPNEAVDGTATFVDGQDGLYCISIRGQNSDGYWGNFNCKCINVDSQVPLEPTNVVVTPYICNQNRTINMSVCDEQSDIIAGEFYLDISTDEIPGGEGYSMGVVRNYNLTTPQGTYFCADLSGKLDVTHVDDGCHYVRTHGEDEAGNWGKSNPNYQHEFILDTTAPETYKNLVGNKIACDGNFGLTELTNVTNGCYYVNQSAYIVLSGLDTNGVQDPACRATSTLTYYQMRWKNNTGDEWGAWSEKTLYNGPIHFTNDSFHEIKYWSEDSCGNKENDNYELDIVDTQAPVSQKTLGTPKRECTPAEKTLYGTNDCWFMTDETKIELSCADQEPHPVNQVSLHYKIEWKRNLEDSWQTIKEGTDDNYMQFYYEDLPTSYWESFHKLTWYCVDGLGNTESQHQELDIVDISAPAVSKSVAEPKVESTQITEYMKPDTFDVKDTAWYIQQGTLITLSCTDVEPHPVGGEKIYYKYYVDGVLHTDWTEYTTAIAYNEDTYHEFYYYCVDALGNRGDTHYELDMVDTAAPSTTVNIEGPRYYDESTHKTYLDGVTKVILTCTDAEPHPVGVDKIKYRYFVDGQLVQNWTDYSFGETGFSFPEESNHTMEYYCNDLLGNTESVQSKIYYVDHTKPITSLAFGTPYFTNGISEWITSSTHVTLTATDGIEVHDSGVEATKYRVTLMEGNEPCLSATACQEAAGSVEFATYSVPFTIGEDSCHLIEYYSYDHVQKTEVVNKKCVFVDNTKPITTKTIGEPKFEFQGVDALISDHTEITLSCADVEPHPVGGEKIYWQWQYSADGVTWGEWSAPEEYTEPIVFEESSFHRMKYWCVDTLGNTEVFHTELDAVDATPPVTTKTIGKPQYYNETTEQMWITQDTTITLECTDPGLHPSGVAGIYYRYNVDSGAWTEWLTYETPFTFGEDSVHTLEYYCVDNFGNQEAVNTEVDNVDTAAPTIVQKFVIKDGARYYETPEQSITVAVHSGDELTFCAVPEDYKQTGDAGVGVNKIWAKFSFLDDPGQSELVWNEEEQAYCMTRTWNDCGYWHFEAKANDLLDNMGDWTDGIYIIIDNVKPIGMVLTPHAGNSYYAGKIFNVYAPAVDFGGKYCGDEKGCPASGVDYCDLYAVDYNFENLDQTQIKACYDDVLTYLMQVGAISEIPDSCVEWHRSCVWIGPHHWDCHWESQPELEPQCYDELMTELMHVPQDGNAYVEYIGRVPYENGVCKGYAQIAENTNLTDTVFLAWKIVDKAGNGENALHLALNPFDSDWALFSEQSCDLSMRGTPITMDMYNKGNVQITKLPEDTVLTSGDNITVQVSISDSTLPDQYYRNCEAVIEKYVGEGQTSTISHQYSSHIVAGEPGTYIGTMTSIIPDYAHISSGDYRYTVNCYVNNVPVGSDWFDFKVDNDMPYMGIIYPKENGVYGEMFMPISLYATDDSGIADETVKIRLQEKGTLGNLWCLGGGCQDTGWITLDSQGNNLYSKMINLSQYEVSGGKYLFDAVACDNLYTADPSDQTGLGFNIAIDRNAMHCRMLSKSGAVQIERPQCSDGLDNDNDSHIDYPADLGCSSSSDDDEVNII